MNSALEGGRVSLDKGPAGSRNEHPQLLGPHRSKPALCLPLRAWHEGGSQRR